MIKIGARTRDAQLPAQGPYRLQKWKHIPAWDVCSQSKRKLLANSWYTYHKLDACCERGAAVWSDELEPRRGFFSSPSRLGTASMSAGRPCCVCAISFSLPVRLRLFHFMHTIDAPSDQKLRGSCALAAPHTSAACCGLTHGKLSVLYRGREARNMAEFCSACCISKVRAHLLAMWSYMATHADPLPDRSRGTLQCHGDSRHDEMSGTPVPVLALYMDTTLSTARLARSATSSTLAPFATRSSHRNSNAPSTPGYFGVHSQ